MTGGLHFEAGANRESCVAASNSAACYRRTVTLQAAQAAIARNWTATPIGLLAVREHHYAEDAEDKER